MLYEIENKLVSTVVVNDETLTQVLSKANSDVCLSGVNLT